VEHEAVGCWGSDVVAIEFVADDGGVEACGFCVGWSSHCGDGGVGAVDAELVGSAGVGDEFYSGDGLVVEMFVSDDGVVGGGGFAVEVVDEHEWADIHVFSDGCVDGALVGLEMAFDQGEVAFGGLAVFELFGEVFVGFGVQCEDHDA